MTPPPTARPSDAPDPRLRPMYWGVLVLSLVVLAVNLWLPSHRASPRRHNDWVLPVGLICIGVSGLVGIRHPVARRVLVGAALVLAVAGLVFAITG
ncbi:hypothetical protein tb265_10280 [Gemmatimonadetes bacterium T265]|nr:hypothetical protein tb265_10280 [Gemmatimonadetes bacterium T265]